jgi:chromosome segregation ATPase
MIPEARACSTPSTPTSSTGHTERTPGPCPGWWPLIPLSLAVLAGLALIVNSLMQRGRATANVEIEVKQQNIIKEQQAENSALRSKIAELNAEVERNQPGKVKALEEHIEFLEGRIASLQAENTALQDRILKPNESSATVFQKQSEAISRQTEAIEKQAQRIKEQDERLQERDQTIEQLKSELETLRRLPIELDDRRRRKEGLDVVEPPEPDAS